MKIKIMNRQLLSAAIIIFYLLPLLFFSAYSISLMSHHKSWTILSLGLLLIVGGTLTLMLLIFYWEQSIRDKKSPLHLTPIQINDYSANDKEAKVTSLDSSIEFNSIKTDITDHFSHLNKENSKELNLLQAALKSNQEQQETLNHSLEAKTQELEKLETENKQLQLKAEQVSQNFADYKLFSEEQLRQKQLQITSLQQLLEDQRTEMEKRQEQISQLDAKVHDLSYEIKTLLYLHDEDSSISTPLSLKEADISYPLFKESLNEDIDLKDDAINETKAHHNSEDKQTEVSIKTPLEAVNLLKKCINFAQKLTGSHYYSSESSRYREFSSSYFAIDQRRLFDHLRNEYGALILIYSQKEQKPIFVNSESKALLGWSSEKFITDFNAIMHEGFSDWKKALQILSTGTEAQARLLAKTKNGQEILLNCHLGSIQTGLFRHYIMGVFYPA